MPPQSKKRNRTPAAVVIGEAQDYTDPLKKLTFNPGQTLQEKIVAGARRAEGKPVQPQSNRRAKASSRLVGRLATQAPMRYDENVAQADIAEEDRLVKEGENYFKEIEREAQNYEQATWMPDVTLSQTGGLQPGSGVVLSSMLRSGYKGMGGTLGLIGQTMEDAFGSDDMPTILGQVGTALKGIAQQNEPTFAAYESARPVSQRGVAERTAGFITELGLQLPSMALASELLGPAAGFGAYKVQGLRAAGEEDPSSLAGAFVQGSAEGALLWGLGKTASVLEGMKNPGPVARLLQRSPRLAQAGAQALGGVGQTAAAGVLHPEAPTPDWLDYLHGGITNVIMDPVVLGPSGKARKATEAVTKLTNQPDPSSYNLELPQDNLTNLRQDFWQPKDIPWDDKVTAQLLNRARMQFVDNPGDPDGVLYLNPQALLLFDRATEAAFPGYKLTTRMRQGEVWDANNAQQIAEQLALKSQQLKATIAQLPDGDPKLHELASGAVVYEALAEHLNAAVADGRPLSLRTIQQAGATSSWNPVAREFDQTVVGHESTHVQQQKVATELGLDLRTLTSPGWLADHPIGARVIAGIGEPGNPMQSYDPVNWTTEAIAYAAQPGGDPGLGLTKQERGVLVGDYFAELMDKHGPEVMNQVWVGRMDREVAQVAWQRLYEAGRVRYSRDPVSGKRIGLEWRGVEAPRMPERVPDNGWGMEFQPAWSVEPEQVINSYTHTPLNIQPDPDYDAAHPAGNVADAATSELDPDITHLQQTNASAQVRAEISQQTAAERKAYREVANLRARLRKNTELGILAKQMIDQAGVPQPELLNEISQQRAELAQEHADALKKFRELRKQGNQRKQELAGQLSDNVQRQREEARLAAQGRLANGDALPPLDTPLDQVRMSSEYAKHLANAAKDMLVASGVPILDSSERATHDQLIDAMKAGRTNYEQLTEVAKRYGMKDVVELFERFDQFASAAGRDLAVFGNVQRELNKLRGISPELDSWIDQQAPTIAEIDRVANGPGIARQLVNLNIGARVARAFTQAVNVQTGLANVLAGRTLVNLVDQTMEQASRSQRRTGGVDGGPVKFEQNSVPPLSTVISPILETWRTAKDLWSNPYWFAHGKLPDSADPTQRPGRRSVRIAQELHPAYPELMRKFDSALSDEPIQTHLLPHAESVRAQKDALQLLKNQVANMPAGKDKTQRLARIAEAEKRIGKHSQVVSKVLHEATRGLHKYLTLARMGERFVRTASLVATLDREAARAGYDLAGLDAAGELHKLPEEVVAKAVNESLRDTYGIRPDPNSRWGGLYHDYTHSDNPLWILVAANIPFVGFMGNAAKAFIDHSPLAFAKVVKAENRDMSLAENRDWAIRAMLGTALYAANFYYTWKKYEDAEASGKPAEPWHEVGGVSVRNIPQLAPYAYINDWTVRSMKGLPSPDADSALEFANVVAGLDARSITGTFEWLDGLLKVTQDQSGNKLRKTKEELYKGIGDWFGAYATPLETYNSLGATFVENMRDVKETYGMGAGALFAPLLNHIPVARERLQDRIDPFTGMPVRRTDWPTTRELTGFTIMPNQSYPARIFQHAGIQNKDWIPFTGVPEVDRDLVATVGKLAAERGPLLEQVLSSRELDEQIAMTYQAMTNLAKQAERQVAARHPGVYKQLKDARELNRWEQRVQDRLRNMNGLPSRQEQYKEMEDRAKEFQQP